MFGVVLLDVTLLDMTEEAQVTGRELEDSGGRATLSKVGGESCPTLPAHPDLARARQRLGRREGAGRKGLDCRACSAAVPL